MRDVIPSMMRSLAHIVTRLSVRARIAAIALIPVAGFVANGVVFTAGDAEVERAFLSVREASAVAVASREFKAAVNHMRWSARDFAQRPSRELIRAFNDAYIAALENLTTVRAASSASNHKSADIETLRVTVEKTKSNFDKLATAQEQLGFTDEDGIRHQLKDAANAIERATHGDMSWLAESDARQIVRALLTMRTYEADYRLQPTDSLQTLFELEYQNVAATLENIPSADARKKQLVHVAKVYHDTFAAWIASVDRLRPYLALIDIDTKQTVPLADRIVAVARDRAADASAALSASQNWTKTSIIGVGVMVVFIGLALSWLIGRSITRPLNGLATVMTRLADGDTSTRIPATEAKDEIGTMARTVIVFRDRMVERERLSETQAEANRARENRSETIARMRGF